MGIELKTGFIGLATNTADLQAPPGALARANNVVIRRAGAIETRPGLKQGSAYGNGSKPMRIIPYEEKAIFALLGDAWWDADDNIALLYPKPDGSGDLAPPMFRDDLIPSAQTRGNLYVGTGVGVLKFDGTNDPIAGVPRFITTGVPLMFNLLIAGGSPTGAWLAAGSQVGYAIVGIKTDANGLVIRSRPTGTVYYTNPGPSANSPVINIFNQWPTRLFDAFEIYRTRAFPSSVTPDAEMAYVGVVAPTSAGPSVFADRTPDASRGATLYTSPSRDGIAGANDRPPACGAMAVFKGALFCGNTIGPQRAIPSVYTDDVALTGSTTGVGYRVISTVTTTVGLTTATFSSTVGIQRGMVTNNLAFPSGSYITNISGSTVTLSQAATSSVSNVMTWFDTISLDGGVTWLSVDDIRAFGAPITSKYVTYRVTPPLGGQYNNTFVVETVMPGPGSSLALLATHGDEYYPALPLYGSSPYVPAQDVYPNGLRWSKPDEPEHFPPVNFAFVGDKKREILALVSTRDALFIFKEDGVWRLTGIAGQYRIDPFDLTTRCVLPSSVVPLRNKIYMLSNKGVVAVSDEGVEIISRPIADQLKFFTNELTINKPFDGGYYFDGWLGQTMGYAGAANERDHEYMLVVYDMLEDQASGITKGMLVYNADTQTWVSWSFPESDDYGVHLSSIAWHERDGTLWIGQAFDVGRIKKLAYPGAVSGADPNFPYKADAEVFINVITPGATIEYSPAIEMVVGDLVYTSADGTVRTVIAVVDTTHATLDSAAPTGGGYFIKPIVSTVRPRPFIAPNQVQKLWSQVVAETTECVGVSSMTHSALSSVMAATDTLVTTPTDIAKIGGVTKYKLGGALRGWLPAQSARGWKMIAEFAWKQAFGQCSIEAIMAETREGKTNTPNLTVAQ